MMVSLLYSFDRMSTFYTLVNSSHIVLVLMGLRWAGFVLA